MSSDTDVRRVPTFEMAAACGVAVANIYYNQPLLGLITARFAHSAIAAAIPTATQLGYALGLLLLVPLGDLMERRRLIVTQFLVLALTLVAAAAAPSAPALALASLLVGLASAVAQQIVPFAASLAPHTRRGAVIGTVMSGLLAGILLSRTLSGFVGAAAGWRAAFWIGVPLALAAAAVMRWRLPRSAPAAGLPYHYALGSLLHLWRSQPVLREATYIQAALFGSFSVFWTVLALHLQEPVFGLGPAAAGLFGLVGVAGILAAPIAGRVADRRGARAVATMGCTLALISWMFFGLITSLLAMIAGIFLFDAGVQATLVANQHRIYALDPQARNRLNTVFMTGMFVGGAIGSAGAATIYLHFGWAVLCLFGALLALISTLPLYLRRNQV
ncbi:MAG: MFS transporter [Alphaproteobacteria bacterium]|nr:MFS transporter [Alphaproteobacteria bacterium]